MWFKNLRLYRLTEDFTHSPEDLNAALAEHCFEPCGNLDPAKFGWVPPLGRHGSEYVHATNGYIMVCAKKQEKVLPAAVVNEALEEKVFQLSEEEGRRISRKERDELKDEIVFSLMPQAFTRSSLIFAYLAPQEGLLVVNAASAKRAEDLINGLRDALGSFKVIPITSKNAPIQVMTHWLNSGELPADFALGEECELQAGSDGRIVRCKNVDLTADEIRNHLDTGMYAKRLSLSWKDAIHCIIDDELGIKRLKFDDSIREQADERNPESAAEEFDIEFAVMTLELSAFIKAVTNAFGGEELPATTNA